MGTAPPGASRAALSESEGVGESTTDAGGSGAAGQPPQRDSIDYHIVPVIWADTATTNLLNRFREIMLDAKKELDSMSPKQRLNFVLNDINKQTPPVWMTRLLVSEDTKAKITWKNDQIQKGKLWNTSHMEQNKWQYFGVHLSVQSPSDIIKLLDEPLEQDDLLLVIGHAMWLQRLQDITRTPTPGRGCL